MRQHAGQGSTPVGVYFEARASLFVCFKDKMCPRTEGGQGEGGTRCLAAGAFIELSHAQGLGPGIPSCFAARRLRAAGQS